MLQLIYTSRSSAEWDGDLLALGATAAERNAREEITGVLLHECGNFLQALEGPRAIVEDAFLRIINDHRHSSLHVLSRKLLTTREFGDWSMSTLTDPAAKKQAFAKVARIVAAGEFVGLDVFKSRFSDLLPAAGANLPLHPQPGTTSFG